MKLRDLLDSISPSGIKNGINYPHARATVGAKVVAYHSLDSMTIVITDKEHAYLIVHPLQNGGTYGVWQDPFRSAAIPYQDACAMLEAFGVTIPEERAYGEYVGCFVNRGKSAHFSRDILVYRDKKKKGQFVFLTQRGPVKIKILPRHVNGDVRNLCIPESIWGEVKAFRVLKEL